MGYRFSELVDLKRVKVLMQLFYDLTGLPSTLIDLSGNLLETEDGEVVGVGWKSICLDFHRVHPETRRACLTSDTELANTVNAGGRASCYRCLNGLVDAAAPVVIDGRHMVNLFTGQFMFEPPDEAAFRQRAREFGFDEEAYIAALREIPVFSRDHVDKGLSFLDMLAAILAETGLKQQTLMEVNQQIEARIRDRTAELHRAKEAAEAAERLAAERARQLERREAELAALYDRLKDLDRVKTEFFSNVSHEFRTPLTLIAGPVERLLAGGGLSDGQGRDLAVVRTNASTLLKHVNDLLDVTRLDAGRMQIAYRHADLAATVRGIAAHFEALAPERDIRFELFLPDALAAQVDVAKAERVALNLLSNAFKFTPCGGRVACSLAATAHGTARLRVEDSGPGIPPAQRGLVFERFRQGDGGATRQFGGTGLGLSIVKDFTELHGGTVSVGEAPGGGAVIEVELPLAAPAGAVVGEGGFAVIDDTGDGVLAGTLAELVSVPDDGAVGQPVGDGRPLVLVVEDNPALRRFVVQTLEESFDVVAAADGEQGLAKALAHRPDLIIADIMMPQLSGDQMIAALRADPLLCDVPVLVLSAKADDALRVGLLRAGAQDYLVKPFLAEELHARAVNLARVESARAILRRELDSRDRDIARLAQGIAERNHTLQRACSEMAVARGQAEAASQAKSRFLAMVSHELRSPLQNLEIYRTLLEQALVPGAQTGRMLAGIAAAAERMTGIVTTILHYSMIEGGRITVAPEQVHLDRLVAEVVAEMAGRAESKGLALESDAPPLPALSTDPRLLRLVLVNLVDNAVKYTERGRVSVVLRRDAAGQRCTVADTGIGIRAEDRGRIFEAFEQVEEVSHKHTPGVGLGLALVKNVAELLGCRIELDSVPGQGSAFSVVLPAGAGWAA